MEKKINITEIVCTRISHDLIGNIGAFANALELMEDDDIDFMTEIKISAPAGLEGAVIINKVKESEEGVGFDAATEEYVNMVESGILDPVKVTRSALQNATSVASTLLTTESVVANIKEDVPAMPAGGGMGMM